jgi:diguanylate cyclase (GGDEF)-like protein/PAS domain S-box-containing protein
MTDSPLLINESLALFDRDGCLLDWNDGFIAEFSDAADVICHGVSFQEIRSACLLSERSLDVSWLGTNLVPPPFTYINKRQPIEVRQSLTRNNQALRLARGINVSDCNSTYSVLEQIELLRSNALKISAAILSHRTQEDAKLRKAHAQAEARREQFELMARALEMSNQHLLIQNYVLDMLGTNAALTVILNEMIRQIELSTPGAVFSVFLVADNGKELVLNAAPSLPQEWKDTFACVAINDGLGSSGTAAYRAEPVSVEDIVTHPYWQEFQDVVLKFDLRACWSYPIKGNDNKVLGTFDIYLRTAVTPQAPDLHMLRDYANLSRLVIERSRLSNALAESQHLYKLITENSTDVIWVMELPNQIFSYFSPSLEKLCGWTFNDVLNQSPEVLQIDKKIRLALVNSVPLLADTNQAPDLLYIKFELDLPHKAGHQVPVEIAASIMFDTVGHPTRIIGNTRDISERKAAEEVIRKMAFYDLLTGLPNRRLLEDRMDQAVSLAQRNGLRMSLLFIDLDQFKPVNDQLGHDIGDWLLQAAAVRMQHEVRQSDTVARVGGDEFVVLLQQVFSARHAVNVAEKIRSALEVPFLTGNNNTINISCSIGVAVYPKHGSSLQELLRLGDKAMYQAKNSGRNKVVLFSEVDEMDIPPV